MANERANPVDPNRPITRAEASDIALAAAKEAVRQYGEQIFGLMGFNVANFDDMQRLRADLEWADKWRKFSERAIAGAALTIVAMIASGIAIFIWDSLKQAVRVKTGSG